jgi:hypothetical protein
MWRGRNGGEIVNKGIRYILLMVVDVYYGKIGVPAKCGSRYFDKTTPFWGNGIRINFEQFYNRNVKLEWIIIRNPLTHLKSALQTEVMECIDDDNKIEKILNSFVSHSGGTHFHPKFCQNIYKVWYKTKFELKIVDLSNLSQFIEEQLHNIPYNSNEYDFTREETYKTKDVIWERCISLNPTLMDKLIQYTTIDIKYYNALINKDNSLIELI